MELMGITVENDTTWMKFADLLVTSGVIDDWIENHQLSSKEQGADTM